MEQISRSIYKAYSFWIPGLVAGLFLSISFKSHGQGYLEAVNLTDELMPLQVKNSKVDKSFYGNNLQLNDLLPIFLKEDKTQFLLVGLDLGSFSFSGMHPDFPVTNLYSIAPKVGYGWRITQRLFMSAMAIPVLNTDLNEVKGTDVHIGGIVHGAYRINDNLSVKLTLGCIKQYYGPQYIALLGFDWKITERWRLFGDMPIYGTLSYCVSPKVNVGLNYSGVSTSYGLAGQNEYFEYTSVQLGVFGEYYLTSKLALRGTVAYSAQRDMELYNMANKMAGGGIVYIDTGPQTTSLYPELVNGLVYKLSLSVRFPEARK